MTIVDIQIVDERTCDCDALSGPNLAPRELQQPLTSTRSMMVLQSAVAIPQPGGSECGPTVVRWLLYMGMHTHRMWPISATRQIEGLLWQHCAVSCWLQQSALIRTSGMHSETCSDVIASDAITWVLMHQTALCKHKATEAWESNSGQNATLQNTGVVYVCCHSCGTAGGCRLYRPPAYAEHSRLWHM